MLLEVYCIMKKFILFLSLVIGLCLNIFAQYKSEVDNIDVIKFAQDTIYAYYGKTSFEEQEWIRVKNFLTWLEENNSVLIKHFVEQYSISKIDDVEKYIFAFLGANYVSQQLINKLFDLPIRISKDGCYATPQIGICIEPYDSMEMLNVAIHEAVHLLPVLGNANMENTIQYSDMLSEEITIFSQLKYALPLKSGKVVHGTKVFFISYDDEIISQQIKSIQGEYADIAYSIVNYSDYDKNNIYSP